MAQLTNEIMEFLMNQSWQILVVFVVISAGSVALRKASAHWRYLLWLLVLIKCLTPPMFSLPLAVLPEKQVSSESEVVVISEDALETAVTLEPFKIDFIPTQVSSVAAEPVSDIPVGQAVDLAEAEPIDYMESQSDVIPHQVALTQADVPAVKAPVNIWNVISDWSVVCWLIGSGLFVVIAFFKAMLLHRRLCSLRRPVCSALQMEVAAISAVLGMKSPPKTWLVEGYTQPFVWGLIKGSVYLPVDFAGRAMRDRDTILAHELAHVRRCDSAVNVLQLIAQGLFFFHPLVWWANRKLRQEREKCCDEIAIAALAVQPRDYSTTIVDVLVAEVQDKATQPVPTLAVAGPVKNIEERIKTIMTPNRKFYKRPTWITVLTVLILAAVLIPSAVTFTAKAAQKTEEHKQVETAQQEDLSVKAPPKGKPKSETVGEKKFTATLVSGAKVELVGIAELKPTANKWWLPNGRLLAETPAGASELKDRDYQYGFLFNFQASAGSTLLPGPGCGRFLTPMKHLKGDMYGMASSYQLENGKRPISTNIQIGVATGPWNDDSKCSLKPVKKALAQYHGGKIMCMGLDERDGRTFLDVKYESNQNRFDHDLRMVAVTKNGRVVEPKLENWRYAKQFIAGAGARQPLHKGKLVFPLMVDVKYEVIFSSIFASYSFPVPLTDIKNFNLQTRPIEYVGFWNVSLQPGQKTDVKVVVTPKPKIKPVKKATFGPVIERVLNDRGDNCMIDFDTGTLMTPPQDAFKGGSGSASKWIEDHGVDAGCNAQPAVRGLAGLDLIALPRPNTFWEKLPPEDLDYHDNVGLKFCKPGSPIFLTAKGGVPVTYIFKTREGCVGVLQILEVKTTDPRYVKIRYKLLQKAKTSATQPVRIVDKTDYPFVNDPAVIGQWDSVDFVDEIEDFDPATKQFKGELYLKELIFLEGGKIPKHWWTWTKGLLIHHGDKTASMYMIKEINSQPYMFLQWKSGDYTIRHKKPKLYVLKKVQPNTIPPAVTNGAALAIRLNPAIFAASYDGVLAQVNVTPQNNRVCKGQLIAHLDTSELQLELAKSQAELKLARMYLPLKEGQCKEGHISKIELEEAKTRVEIAEISMRQIELKISKSQFIAPFDGYVLFCLSGIHNGLHVKRGQRLFIVEPLRQKTINTTPLSDEDAKLQEKLIGWVEKFFLRNYRDVKNRETIEWGQPQKLADGNYSIRYKFQSRIWGKELMIDNQVFTFTPAGEYLSVKKVAGYPQWPDREPANDQSGETAKSSMPSRPLVVTKLVGKAVENPGEFYVMGKVQRPGQFSLTGRKVTIKMALAAAVLNDLKEIPTATLIRRVTGNKEEFIPLNLKAILHGNHPDMFLQPYDIIFVGLKTENVPEMAIRGNGNKNQEPSEFYVMGDVIWQGVFNLTDRMVTLKLAMAVAGLKNFKEIPEATLIRRVAGEKEKIIPLNLNAIVKCQQPDMFLQPGDLIIVGYAPKKPTQMSSIRKSKSKVSEMIHQPGEFYVMGKVKRPGVYSLLVGRKLTIKQAIAAAGVDDVTKIPASTLIRRDEEDKEEFMPLDIQAIVAGKEPDLFLQPDDVLVIGGDPKAAQTQSIRRRGKPDIATRAFELRLAGKVGQARKLLEKAVKENPENARAQFELARDCFYMMMGPRVAGPGQRKAISKALDRNLKQARTAIMQAIKIEPDNPRYRYWAGKIYSYTAIDQSHSLLGNIFLPRNSKIAIQNYAKAVELKPDFHQARLELMGCYDRLPKNCGGDKAKAQQQARILQESDPVYGALARCEIQPRKTRKEKIEIWEKVLAKEPDNPDACLGLARELLRDGDMSEDDMKKCLQCIDKALKLDPSKGEILLDLAQHYRRRQPEKAGQTIERYLHLSPRPAVAMQALAMRELALIYQAQGKNNQAEIVRKKADELDPTNWPSFRWRPPADMFLTP